MVNHLLVTRKVEKNAMFKFDEGSLEYDAKDRSQKVYKLMANSWYGALSQSSFIFYNKLLGPAVNLLAAVKLF
jgi:DNA polymerase elongation subunit (family B)